MSFKICLIGCGNHSLTVHGPSLKRYVSEHADTLLAACCDLDESRALSYKESFGFAGHYTNFVNMLNHEKPDAVFLIAPVSITADIAAQILEMGYPLMLEKPPARNGHELNRLTEIAERKNVPNRVAFNRRYTPLMRETKSLMEANFKAGSLQSINYDMFRFNRLDEDFSTTAIHGIDAVRFLAGSDYKHIRFNYSCFPELGKGVKNTHMNCIMENGCRVQLNFCPVAGVTVERAIINACGHTIFINLPMWNAYDFPGRLTHIHKEQIMADVSGEVISDGAEVFETGGFYFEDKTFLDDIRAGRKPEGDLAASLQSVEVADCISKMQEEYSRLK